MAPPATKEQVAQRPAENQETPTSQNTLRSDLPDADLVKAMAIHGVTCRGPMTEIIQEVVDEIRGGRTGVMGARWLWGGMRRLAKVHTIWREVF